MRKSIKHNPKHPFSGEIILKGMPEFAYVFNKKDELVMWNKNLETVLGYSADELYKKMYMILWKIALRLKTPKP
jgi:PAS domain S-box-containing protein